MPLYNSTTYGIMGKRKEIDMIKIDLHIHSTASDGTDSPSEIIEKVASISEKAVIALTDHDTTAGTREFSEAAEKYSDRITAIKGVEISTDYNGVEIHMLGLNIDPDNVLLNEKLALFRESRDRRNTEMIAKLNEYGFDISMDDIELKDPGETMARPDIARALLKKGYVSSIQEAFDKYIADDAPCFVSRTMPTPKESIELITEAGGTPVLAHIMLYKKLDEEKKRNLVKELKDYGLKGIETYYSDYTEEGTAFVESLAKEFNLFRTAGSDYHGGNKPHISLFTGTGNLNPPEEILDDIDIFA